MSYWIGWALSGLAILFLAMDAAMKLLALPVVLRSGDELGFPGADMARTLGLVLAISTALYALPRTSLLGAVLVTAYLGGAVATHVRVGSRFSRMFCSACTRAQWCGPGFTYAMRGSPACFRSARAKDEFVLR